MENSIEPPCRNEYDGAERDSSPLMRQPKSRTSLSSGTNTGGKGKSRQERCFPNLFQEKSRAIAPLFLKPSIFGEVIHKK
ncbi:MAG: hypothetical protein C6P37_13450 [Caldibacillus debilis]|uniref:Uncharacterized protein n=1 Tax=Caldibacillus debilis TaxID=301148 RepID=A0A3E0K0M5_9BACI|nr:MAG: hypothetical protein C6P37_13450 [Caldibacillus debilis]